MDKLMWSAHTADHRSALETTDILMEAATWMDLEDIVPSEISSQRDKYCVSHCYKGRQGPGPWRVGPGGRGRATGLSEGWGQRFRERRRCRRRTAVMAA